VHPGGGIALEVRPFVMHQVHVRGYVLRHTKVLVMVRVPTASTLRVRVRVRVRVSVRVKG
jgi:hypothetical protein